MIEIQNETPRNIQTKEDVMACTSAVPQTFYLSGKSLVSHHSGPALKGTRIPGSIVSNKLKPGSFGLAASVPTNDASQSLITTIQSSNETSQSRIFDFMPMFESLKDDRPMQICLRIRSNNGSATDTPTFFHNGNGEYNHIPLVVGPGTISIAEGWTPEELSTISSNMKLVEDLSIPWGSLLKGVVKAVPVIADAGLTLYDQLTKESSNNNKGKDEEAILGLLASAAASFAVPLISSLL